MSVDVLVNPEVSIPKLEVPHPVTKETQPLVKASTSRDNIMDSFAQVEQGATNVDLSPERVELTELSSQLTELVAEVAVVKKIGKQALLFDKARSLIKRIKDPEVAGFVTAATLGALGMITQNAELAQLALIAGGATMGMGRGEGVKGKVAGAILGGAGGALASEALHDPTLSSAASVLDDAVPLAAVAFSQARSKQKEEF